MWMLANVIFSAWLRFHALILLAIKGVPGVFACAAHHLQRARALDTTGHGKAAARGTAEARPQIALRAALNANFAPPLVGAYSAPLALPAEALELTVLTHGPSAVYCAGAESPHALASPLLGWRHDWLVNLGAQDTVAMHLLSSNFECKHIKGLQTGTLVPWFEYRLHRTPMNPTNTTNAPTLYGMYTQGCQLLENVADFVNFGPRLIAVLGLQTREQPVRNPERNERSAGKRPWEVSDDVAQGSQATKPKLKHNVEVVAARQQAMYDHPDMIWNQGGSQDILFTDEQVPEELKVMMHLNQPFNVFMSCQDVVVNVRAFLMMGMRRPYEKLDRFQMCLLHGNEMDETLSHWFSNNEIEQLNLINMNSLLKTGHIQPWMQCNKAVATSATHAPAVMSSGSGGGAARGVIGSASSAPLAAHDQGSNQGGYTAPLLSTLHTDAFLLAKQLFCPEQPIVCIFFLVFTGFDYGC